MHQPDPGRPEPFTYQNCRMATWAAPRVTVLRCRHCDHVWQVRPPHTAPPRRPPHTAPPLIPEQSQETP